MSTPKISVIVPVYNAEKWLHRCIDSILAQTFTDFELLLIDDGSTDVSGAICDEYAQRDSRVRIFHKPNGGVSSARNLGLDNAQGEWISFVDADDWIDGDFLKLLKDSAKEKEADIVMCDFCFVYQGRRVESKTYDWVSQGFMGLKEYISTSWTCLCGSIHKKRLYDENNLRSPEGVTYCEDFHLITRLCFFANKVAKVAKPMYHYRQQDGSIMHNLNDKTWGDELKVYIEIIDFFKSQGVYDEFEECMSWRTLKASQDMALDISRFEDFRQYNPAKRMYIFGCPFINLKLKINMWMLTHHLSLLSVLFVYLRKIFNR